MNQAPVRSVTFERLIVAYTLLDQYTCYELISAHHRQNIQKYVDNVQVYIQRRENVLLRGNRMLHMSPDHELRVKNKVKGEKQRSRPSVHSVPYREPVTGQQEK